MVMNMKIVEYFSSECPEHWLSEIGRCDWRAGQFLHQLLRERRFHALLGEKSKLLLLTEGNHLIAFCTSRSSSNLRCFSSLGVGSSIFAAGVPPRGE